MSQLDGIADVLSGKTAVKVNVQVAPLTFVGIGVAFLVAVFAGVFIAIKLSK